jgi:DNA-binding transcriptional regulator YdaS (Cro superfamily)
MTQLNVDSIKGLQKFAGCIAVASQGCPVIEIIDISIRRHNEKGNYSSNRFLAVVARDKKIPGRLAVSPLKPEMIRVMKPRTTQGVCGFFFGVRIRF